MKNKKRLLKVLIIIVAFIAIMLLIGKAYAEIIDKDGIKRAAADEKTMIKNCVLKVAGESSNNTITAENLKTQLNRYLGSNKVKVEENTSAKTIDITYIASDRTYTVKTDTLEIAGDDSGGTTTEGTYLPAKFTQVAGTTLENGLTIQDSTGNQYVWVEVPKTTTVYPTAGLDITSFTDEEYTKIEKDLQTYTNDYRETGYKDEYYSDEVTGLTSAQYTELKRKMLKSIYQNGGFYVGKYETGIESTPKTSGSETTAPTETPVIKQNAYPYNNVTCSQAQTLASSMESGNYTSSLMFGVQWNLVLKYLETEGTLQSELKSDSTNWGNYYNSLWDITNASSKYTYSYSNWVSGAYGAKTSSEEILLSTGASDSFSKQGIYDLAGNVLEWTLEYSSFSSGPCVYRGGNYYRYGTYGSANTCFYTYTTDYGYNLGFRVALF